MRPESEPEETLTFIDQVGGRPEFVQGSEVADALMMKSSTGRGEVMQCN